MASQVDKHVAWIEKKTKAYKDLEKYNDKHNNIFIKDIISIRNNIDRVKFYFDFSNKVNSDYIFKDTKTHKNRQNIIEYLNLYKDLTSKGILRLYEKIRLLETKIAEHSQKD
uniref:Uncharacterized protein n=1 Tax=viral metagenome TaxID=1070528 RepID=A0A6C0EDB4_9ZZZZ